jgi:type I restriction enzyme S subunit
MDIELDYATSNITNNDDLREKIHEIHNYMRNNGIGYGLTSLKVFNLFYGLMKIEEYNLNEKIGLNDDICKFSHLVKLAKDYKLNTDILDKLIDIIYDNDDVKLLLGYNIPLDLRNDVYNHLIIEINSIKEIEKSSKEQLSGKIYEYFVGRDQSAISELGAYFTNRRIVDFILNKTKPHLKADGNIPKMIDMFGGSGGFTIGYMDYLNKNFKIDWKNQLSNIYHIDINEDVLKSARLEFFCLSNGVFPDRDNIIRKNSFKKEFDNEKFDLILTNPPYGGDKIGASCKKEKRDKIIKYIENEFSIFKKNIIEREDIKSNKKLFEDIKKSKIDKILKLVEGIDDIQRIQHLYNQLLELKKENKIEIENNKKLCVNIQSCSTDIHRFAVKHKLTGTDKEACSLMLIMDLLEINGTAVGVLKEGLFFDSSYMELRKILVKEYNVKEIISIPSNQFENTSTKTSIVIFTREEQKTSQINFSELKVNLYENDEFIEKDNKIYLKFNKGDIKEVEEIFIKSVSVDEILNNENISLNSKDYNKVSIQCGENFKLVKLCELSDINIGSTPNTKNYNYWENGDIDWISISDFNNEIITNTKKKLTKNGAETMMNRKIPYNSILLSFKLTIGKVAFAGKHNMYCNEAITYLNSKIKNVSQLYLFNILKCIDIKQFGRGTIGSNGSLSKNILENLEIPIPETEEILKYWDNKISTPYNLKQEKERRFKEVEDEIQMKIKLIQENEKCEEVKLGDICKYKDGYNFYRNQMDERKKFIKDENLPLLKISANDINDYIKINEKYDKFILNYGDIVIGITGSCGKIRKINIEKGYYVHGLLKLQDFKINKEFIYYYLQYYMSPENIEKLTNKTVLSYMKISKLNELKIKLPMDKSLIDNLQPLFDEVEKLQKEIKELDETYNNYLQELSKSAIKNQEILNGIHNEPTIDEITGEEKEDDVKTEETKSNKSLTIDELKEQCKSLGIKGYSKKKKDELIEMIKNHK